MSPRLALEAQQSEKDQNIRCAPETIRIIQEIRRMIGTDKRLGSYQSIVAQAVGCYLVALRAKRVCSF